MISAISIKVASLNTTYGGNPSSSAIDLRSLRSLANSFLVVVFARQFVGFRRARRGI